MERDMFNTMTLTKILGAICGALLVFLLGSWAADTIYSDAQPHGVEVVSGYDIVVEEDEEDGAEAEPEIPFAEYLAAADPAAGERVYSKCRACHKLDEGVNGVGPNLFGVVDRAVGSADGYAYSGAMVAVVSSWSPEDLSNFLENPRGFAPGTKMGFRGLPKIEDRANLIAYLATIGG